MKLNWRPHTEVPDPEKDESEAFLIAEQNCDGDLFLVEELFYHQSFKGEPRRWLREGGWEEYKPEARFFWLPVSELLAALHEIAP